jgi:hypothetical protein
MNFYQYPKSGPGNVAEYLCSAIPWVTSSTVSGTLRIDFSYVTRFVAIKNNSPTGSTNLLSFGFTQNGVKGTNKIELMTGESFREEIRIKTLFLSSSNGVNVPYVLFAGLTTVDSRDFPILTGSMNEFSQSYGGIG